MSFTILYIVQGNSGISINQKGFDRKITAYQLIKLSFLLTEPDRKPWCFLLKEDRHNSHDVSSAYSVRLSIAVQLRYGDIKL